MSSSLGAWISPCCGTSAHPSRELSPRFRWRARNLSERVALRANAEVRHASGADVTDRIGLAMPPQSDELIERWLTRAGSSTSELPALMGDARRLRDSNPPDWERLLAHVLSAPHLEAAVSARAWAHMGEYALLAPFLYWAIGAAGQLARHGAIAESARQSLRDEIASIILASLKRRSSRAVILQLHIARLRGELGDEAAGVSAFASAVATPRRLRRFFLEYPALARMLAGDCLNVAEAIHELLIRFESDREAIRATIFDGQLLGSITSLSTLGGDPHGGGREVMKLGLESGQSLIYKPRSLATDVAFQHLLRWTNDSGFEPAFRLLKVVSRPAHGWCEFVATDAETTAEGLHRFYRRQGGNLALLHMLLGTDFHSENVLASGEDPMLVDLEALFHHVVSNMPVAEPGAQLLTDSVLTVGLLPNWVETNRNEAAVDLSGLGAPDGQHYGHEGETVDRSSGAPRIVRQRLAVGVARNRPRSGGQKANVWDYEEDLVEGFLAMHAVLGAHRDTFLSPAGPLAAFADAEVRQVLRPTMVYGHILSRTLHPDFLRDVIDREMYFVRLWAIASSLGDFDAVAPLEIMDLLAGDIPKFTTTPSRRSIWDSRGTEVPGFLPSIATDRVRERVEASTPDCIRQQLEIIRGSIRCLDISQHRQLPPAQWRIWTADDHTSTGPMRTVDDFASVASAIGKELCDTAVMGDGLVSWLAMDDRGANQLQFGTVSDDLYSGKAGIAVFLSYLNSVRPDTSVDRVAAAAITTILRQIAAPRLPWGGAFTGLGSVVNGLMHCAVIRGDDSLLSGIDRLLHEYPPATTTPVHDIIGGMAGLALVLIDADRRFGIESARSHAIRLGEALCDAAVEQPGGVGWNMPAIQTFGPLAGYAHGAGGIAQALLAIAEATGIERFHDVGMRAIAYEDSLYNPERTNWPDLRDLERIMAPHDDLYSSIAWCHGAPGLLLGRLHTPGQPLPHDWVRVMNWLAERPAFGSDCVCHGELSVIETFVAFALHTGEQRWSEIARRRASDLMRRHEHRGEWRCGLLHAGVVPGLLVGTAGIGLEYLRLAEPQRIPSIWAVEFPAVAAVSSEYLSTAAS